MRALACVAVALQLIATAPTAGDPLELFAPDTVLTPADRRLLERGAPVIKILDGPGREFAVFTAVALDPGVTIERATAWLRAMEALRRNRFVLASGRFSDPPALADLDALTLNGKDLEAIRDCRPGRCDVKLSAAEIDELTRVIAAAGAGWRAALQPAFRAIVLRRVNAYAAGGHRALAPVSDRKRPRSPQTAFEGLLEHSRFIGARLPQVVERVTQCPPAAAAEDAFMYWSQEELGGRAVVSATHLSVLTGDGVSAPEALTAGVQIFATHYLDASLGVTAVVRDPAASRLLFIHVNRSEVDLLGGFWGGIARSIIEGRIKKDGPVILRAVKERIDGKEPPIFPRRPGSF